MAAKPIETLQKEVDGNFNLFDASLPLNEFPWREDDLATEDNDPILINEDDPVGEFCNSTWPEYTYAKCSIANYRASCASPVEVWINEEFGDDDDDHEASQAMHDEANSYTILIRQVGEYIDSLDFVHATIYSIYGDHVDADVLYPRVDSDDVEMFYEPQLWCFI